MKGFAHLKMLQLLRIRKKTDKAFAYFTEDRCGSFKSSTPNLMFYDWGN